MERVRKEVFEAGREEGKQETLQVEIFKLRAEQVKAYGRSFDKGKGKGATEAFKKKMKPILKGASWRRGTSPGGEKGPRQVEEKGQKEAS